LEVVEEALEGGLEFLGGLVGSVFDMSTQFGDQSAADDGKGFESACGGGRSGGLIASHRPGIRALGGQVVGSLRGVQRIHPLDIHEWG